MIDIAYPCRHVFKVRTPDHRGWLRTKKAYDEEAFERVMGLLDYHMPLGMAAYHFHGDLDNPAFLSYPEIDLDVEAIFLSAQPFLERIRNRHRGLTAPIAHRMGEYVLTIDPSFECIYFDIVDGKNVQLTGSMEIVPVSFRQARAFVEAHHRHCCPPHTHKFSLGLAWKGGGPLPGVAVTSTPKARLGFDEKTLEINRVCVFPPTQNGCTRLYGAAVSAGRAMGYRHFVTYTLLSEDASSVRAAGFHFAGLTRPGGWNRPSRRRDNNKYPNEHKKRWMRE